MKIFQLVFLPDKYQSLDLKNKELSFLSLCPAGKSRREIWPEHLELEVAEPTWPKGVFLQMGPGEFVLTKETWKDKVLVNLLENDGEFLPVFVDGEPLLLHNITRFANCVDQDRSKWGLTIGNVPGRIECPRFLVDEVPLGVHFRIREFSRPRCIATDPKLSPEQDFFQWYHKMDYKGLEFRLLWDSEKPDDLIRFY